MEHKPVTDALGLHAELDGVAYILLGISNQLIGKGDALSNDGLHEALHAIQEHIFRISEDWMIYTEMLEERIKEQAGGQADEGHNKEN